MLLLRRFALVPVLLLVAPVMGCTDVGDSPYVLLDAQDSVVAPTDTDAAGGLLDFDADIRPILDRNTCTKSNCHSAADKILGLDLTTAAGLLAGGASGPAVVRCDPDSSLIIGKIGPSPPTGIRMPIGADPVSDGDIAILRQWISEGAGDPSACGGPKPDVVGTDTPADTPADVTPDNGPADVRPADVPPADVPGDVGPPVDVPAAGIDWMTQVMPLLETAGCTQSFCHSASNKSSGLDATTVGGLLAGGNNGPAVVACDSSASNVIGKVVAPAAFGSLMPIGKDPLTAAQVKILADWIDQGAGETYDPTACD